MEISYKGTKVFLHKSIWSIIFLNFDFDDLWRGTATSLCGRWEERKGGIRARRVQPGNAENGVVQQVARDGRLSLRQQLPVRTWHS